MLATLGDPGNKKPIGIRSDGPLMLPGFNHNIRHQDRVFHVQTEDNGLAQARLVTQTFIDGQIVDIERSSYKDLLDGESDDKTRTDRIRVRMQEQHKGQMKRLVSGKLDERIAMLFAKEGTPTASPEAQGPVPDAVMEAAEALPLAVPELALKPTPTDLPTLDMPAHPALRGTDRPPAEDPTRQSHPDFLIELDEEMRRHAPWRPTKAQLAKGQQLALETADTVPPPDTAPRPRVRPLAKPALPPSVRPTHQTPVPPPSPVLRTGTVPAENRPNPVRQPAQPRPGAGRAIPQLRANAGRIAPPPQGRPATGRAFPPPGDTIVDMGLPASLKDSLAKRRAQSAKLQPPPVKPAARAKPARPRPAPPPVYNPRGLAPRPRPGQTFAHPNDTMLEIDAAELQSQVAAQRARLRQQAQAQSQNQTPPSPPAPKPPKPPEARGNIVVVERSLDDVILGYLSSDD